MKMGAEKLMARFALLNMPFLAALILPAYKTIPAYRDANPFYLTDGFIYAMIISTSIINGFARGIV